MPARLINIKYITIRALVQLLLCTARGSLKIQDPKEVAKTRHLGTIAQLCRAISSQMRHVSTIGKKNLLSSNISSTWSHNMVNFSPLAAEIVSGVWGIPTTFNGFRVLAALLHGSQVVSVSQTLRRWTEGATCVRQGDHHVGHWPTFLVHTFVNFPIFLKLSNITKCFEFFGHHLMQFGSELVILLQSVDLHLFWL